MDAAVLPIEPRLTGAPESGVPSEATHCLFFYREGLGGMAECVSGGIEGAAEWIPAGALEEARAYLEKTGRMEASQACLVVVMRPPDPADRTGEAAAARLADSVSPIVQKTLGALEEHYMQGLSASTLARQLKVTTSYLCRIFKAETGTTISGHLAERRVREAARLLQTDLTLSIKEIAFAVGFGSLPQFNRIFRKHTSLSPRDYRRKGG